jgi:hypothetical protein
VITSLNRAGAEATAIIDHLKREGQMAPAWDDFDMEASSVMTIISREGDSMRTLRKIAAELREKFVLRVSNPSPVVPRQVSDPPGSNASPIPRVAPGGTER